MARQGINWAHIFTEFVAIVFGVLLALAVDDWRQQREVDAAVIEATQRLNAEIMENYREIKASRRIIAERLEKLKALKVDGSQGFFAYDDRFGGFNFPELRDSVWQRVTRDRIANSIPSDYIDATFGLYSSDHFLETMFDRISTLTLSHDYFDPASARVALQTSQALMTQQILWSDDALARYDKFIKQHITRRGGGVTGSTP